VKRYTVHVYFANLVWIGIKKSTKGQYSTLIVNYICTFIQQAMGFITECLLCKVSYEI